MSCSIFFTPVKNLYKSACQIILSFSIDIQNFKEASVNPNYSQLTGYRQSFLILLSLSLSLSLPEFSINNSLMTLSSFYTAIWLFFVFFFSFFWGGIFFLGGGLRSLFIWRNLLSHQPRTLRSTMTNTGLTYRSIIHYMPHCKFNPNHLMYSGIQCFVQYSSFGRCYSTWSSQLASRLFDLSWRLEAEQRKVLHDKEFIHLFFFLISSIS